MLVSFDIKFIRRDQKHRKNCEVKYIVKLHFRDIKKLAIIDRWLLLKGDRSWRFHCTIFFSIYHASYSVKSV